MAARNMTREGALAEIQALSDSSVVLLEGPTVAGRIDLYHAGIAGDAPGGRSDCHGQGRAVDFVGVWGAHPVDGSELYLTVFDDWGNVAIEGLTLRGGDWPSGTAGNTSFRLDDPSADPVAAAFFGEFYAFAAGEWQDRTSGEDEGSPTTPGSESGFIMHPDHPDTDPGGPHGREAHKGHLHMQIGVTGTEA